MNSILATPSAIALGICGPTFAQDDPELSAWRANIDGTKGKSNDPGIHATVSQFDADIASTVLTASCVYIGAGMHCDASSPTLDNCILWDNQAVGAGSEIYNGASIPPTVTYSDVKGGWSGTGNIDADPLFVDPVNGDFYLQAGSPCIDTGDPNSSPDPDGTPADMGAYYFHQTTPTLSVTNLVAGQTALVEVTNATPNNFSHFAWSIHGGGPTSTPWGDAMVSAPYDLTLLATDANGYASHTANVPASAVGITVWMHGTDVGTQSMLNPLMMVIQ